MKGKHPEAKQLDAFLERVHYLGFNSDEAAEYHLLVEKIAELRKAKDIPDHLIFTWRLHRKNMARLQKRCVKVN